MSQEYEEINWHLKLVSRQFEFLEISRACSSVAKNTYFKRQSWARLSDEEAPLDQWSR